jgi:hypothetical protein
MSKKSINKKLDKLSTEEHKKQFSHKKLSNKQLEDIYEPTYIDHYVQNHILGDEKVCRTRYFETRDQDGSVFGVDIRNFIRKTDKPAYKQGIIIQAEHWHPIFLQFVNLTMELSEPEDWMFTLKNMIEATVKKYPQEFQKAFCPVTSDTVAPVKKVEDAPPIRKISSRSSQTPEDTNWGDIMIQSKAKKTK